MCHMSCVMCKVWHVTFQPFPNRKKYGPANFLILFTTPYHVSCVPCHISCVTCHLSHVTCQVSRVTFIFFFFSFTKWYSSLVEGLLSTGPTPSSFRLFLIKYVLIPKIYLSWLVGVLFSSLKKNKLMTIQFQSDCNRQEVPKISNPGALGTGPLRVFSKVRRQNRYIFFLLRVGCFLFFFDRPPSQLNIIIRFSKQIHKKIHKKN